MVEKYSKNDSLSYTVLLPTAVNQNDIRNEVQSTACLLAVQTI
jgi:hypothetical protein